MTSSCSREYVIASVFVYSIQPERVLNPEGSDTENEEVKNRLEGTFWCAGEQCQIMPTQRECVCCREQPEEVKNKVNGRTDFKLILHRLKKKQFSF